jgi:tetratricopeptide (TPR) repeat protein
MSKRASPVLFFLTALVLSQQETDLIAKYERDIKANNRRSITHFRIGEIYFHQRDYQSAANEFREALNGDLQPPWIEVWAHVNLGKIFDITTQRERALNEYRLARLTKDNTRGALDEAEIYAAIPYPHPKAGPLR